MSSNIIICSVLIILLLTYYVCAYYCGIWASVPIILKIWTGFVGRWRSKLALPIRTNMKNVVDERIFSVKTAWCARRGPFIFYQPPYQFLNHDRAIFQPSLPFPVYATVSKFFPPQNTLWKEHYSRRICVSVDLQSKHILKRMVKRFQVSATLKFINHWGSKKVEHEKNLPLVYETKIVPLLYLSEKRFYVLLKILLECFDIARILSRHRKTYFYSSTIDIISIFVDIAIYCFALNPLTFILSVDWQNLLKIW